MLNPDTGKNLEPVTGADGQTAESAIEKYRKGESKKQKAGQYGIIAIERK
jgi:hypothetical protein